MDSNGTDCGRYGWKCGAMNKSDERGGKESGEAVSLLINSGSDVCWR